jgi:excisionase family DNA binding protein
MMTNTSPAEETLNDGTNPPRGLAALQDSILTIDEVAAILRCSKTHVSNALNGKIPGTPRLTHFSIGRRKLIRKSWLEEWMEANRSSDTMGPYGQTARFGRKK